MSNSTQSFNLSAQLLQECQIMAQHAFTSGLNRIPVPVVQAVDSFAKAKEDYDDEQLSKLVDAHKMLVQIVAPARPETLVMLAQGNEDKWICRLLGPVSLVRQLTAVAILFMGIFITLTILQIEGDASATATLPASAELLNLLHFITAAGLGAAFTALFKSNRFITEGTFDPTFAFSYWIRFTLGLMAGLILAVLIPIEESFNMSPVLLALLGGFSADVLFRILTRLTDTLETVVRGQVQTQTTAVTANS